MASRPDSEIRSISSDPMKGGKGGGESVGEGKKGVR